MIFSFYFSKCLLKHNCFIVLGMSGSCSVRVCWRRLPAFRVAGAALAALHEGAALVRLAQRGGRRPARLRPARPDLKRPNKTDLVYLEDSPDYCEKNITWEVEHYYFLYYFFYTFILYITFKTKALIKLKSYYNIYFSYYSTLVYSSHSVLTTVVLVWSAEGSNIHEGSKPQY